MVRLDDHDPGSDMADLRYRMLTALNAADLGSPLCEQTVSICAEIAEQYCAETHLARDLDQAAVPPVLAVMPTPRVPEARGD